MGSGTAIEKIFVLQSAGGEEINEIKAQARALGIPLSAVPAEKLERYTQSVTQGVVAIAGLIQYQQLQDIIDFVIAQGRAPLLVVLDGITDTRNLGAIARSAHCFGADALVLPQSNSAAVTDDAIKTSAGALERLAVCREASIEQIVDTLHLNGINTVAMVLDTAHELAAEQLDGPLALILGAEDKGVGAYVLRKAQRLVKIEQSQGFDSLNVSVAAGIALYECSKQRAINA